MLMAHEPVDFEQVASQNLGDLLKFEERENLKRKIHL